MTPGQRFITTHSVPSYFAATGRALVAYEVAIAAMLWLVVAVNGATGYARRTGRPLRRRAA